MANSLQAYWLFSLNYLQTKSSLWGMGSPVKTQTLSTYKISHENGIRNSDTPFLMDTTFFLSYKHSYQEKNAETFWDLLGRIGGIINIFILIMALGVGNLVSHFQLISYMFHHPEDSCKPSEKGLDAGPDDPNSKP